MSDIEKPKDAPERGDDMSEARGRSRLEQHVTTIGTGALLIGIIWLIKTVAGLEGSAVRRDDIAPFQQQLNAVTIALEQQNGRIALIQNKLEDRLRGAYTVGDAARDRELFEMRLNATEEKVNGLEKTMRIFEENSLRKDK